jgi:hypothetical protein
MPPHPISTFGIIIGSFDSGEKDKIIKILGTKTGKIGAIAKRCRGINQAINTSKKISLSNASFVRQPELFDHGEFYLSSGRRSSSASSTPSPSPGGLYTLQPDTTLKSPFLLSDSIAKLILASFIAETLDALTTDSHQEDGNYVAPALEALLRLSQTTSVNETLKVAFSGATRLLAISGFGLPTGLHATNNRQQEWNTEDAYLTGIIPNKRNLRAVIHHISDIRGFGLESESSVELLLSKT